jgi:hypothetical protein
MLERRLRVALLLVASGCAHSKVSAPSSATSGACVYDDDQAQECQRKGRGFRYGPTPIVHCSGVPPAPDDHSQQVAAARSSPCICIDDAALAEQRAFCSELP